MNNIKYVNFFPPKYTSPITEIECKFCSSFNVCGSLRHKSIVITKVGVFDSCEYTRIKYNI
jgi:hypothetical protein